MSCRSPRGQDTTDFDKKPEKNCRVRMPAHTPDGIQLDIIPLKE
ncbi:hypothetical protein HMPREF1545_03652 [Oscillibacter sp. KLE 1728]|nr:hypothetical protein HMPREF1545_03652 [Oscillibacter sp. KLE 1728]ERK62020.1 hypothetical protein HMPREF1546_02836 [Oscillibacter sp. KLE 1745]